MNDLLRVNPDRACNATTWTIGCWLLSEPLKLLVFESWVRLVIALVVLIFSLNLDNTSLPILV